MKQLTILVSVLMIMFISSAHAQYNLNLVETTTIASGQTTSGYIDMKDWKLAAVIFPSAFTGTSVTVLTSADTTSANFKPVKYDGTAISIGVTTNTQCGVPATQIYQLLRYIKLQSNSTEAAQRILQVVRARF